MLGKQTCDRLISTPTASTRDHTYNGPNIVKCGIVQAVEQGLDYTTTFLVYLVSRSLRIVIQDLGMPIYHDYEDSEDVATGREWRDHADFRLVRQNDARDTRDLPTECDLLY